MFAIVRSVTRDTKSKYSCPERLNAWKYKQEPRGNAQHLMGDLISDKTGVYFRKEIHRPS